MKIMILLIAVLGIIAGCSSPQKTIYTPEELEQREFQSQVDSIAGQIRFHQEMIRIKQTELAANRSEASLYPPESAQYKQLASEANVIRDRINALSILIEQKDARLSALRAQME